MQCWEAHWNTALVEQQLWWPFVRRGVEEGAASCRGKGGRWGCQWGCGQHCGAQACGEEEEEEEEDEGEGAAAAKLACCLHRQGCLGGLGRRGHCWEGEWGRERAEGNTVKGEFPPTTSRFRSLPQGQPS